MADVLGLLAECMQVARDIGYRVREEALGDLAGGECVVGGRRQILLNIEHGPQERLEKMLDILAADPAAMAEPKSRALVASLAARSR